MYCVSTYINKQVKQTGLFWSIFGPSDHSGGLEQWMSGMGMTLNQQELIAARVKLIEGQIEGFKVRPIYCTVNIQLLC